MDIELVFPEGSEKNAGKAKALVHWGLIKNYMESNDMDADVKILLCERLITLLKTDAVIGSHKKYTET